MWVCVGVCVCVFLWCGVLVLVCASVLVSVYVVCTICFVSVCVYVRAYVCRWSVNCEGERGVLAEKHL